MKILLGSHCFSPSIGGIETVTHLLAREFVAAGHEVRVVTQTPGDGKFPFPVLRRAGAAELLQSVKWCDVFLQNNISLRTIWPLLFVRRPLFIIHQTWLQSAPTTGWKRLAIHLARQNFAISRAIGHKLPVAATEIGNPYDSQVFRCNAGTNRSREFVFVGRLVSDKGVHLLLQALAQLKSSGLTPRLTIVGEGPERASLEKVVQEFRLQDFVIFAGQNQGPELADILNEHQVLVVPSLWPEPFGIVAVEGIACGCVVIGSSGGGLPEAVGPCGVTFPNGDATALAQAMRDVLTNPGQVESFRQRRAEHLARFEPRRVAAMYLQSMGGER